MSNLIETITFIVNIIVFIDKYPSLMLAKCMIVLS